MMTHIKTCLAMIVKSIKEYILPILTLLVVFFLVIVGPILFARFAYKRNKALYDHLMKIENVNNDNTLTIPEGGEVYIVQPNGEQEVVIIGDPENIKVKPKKK